MPEGSWVCLECGTINYVMSQEARRGGLSVGQVYIDEVKA